MGEIVQENKPFAISITLYGLENEEKATYSQHFIPWKMMKEAVKLTKKAEKFDDVSKIDEETLDDISNFVVALFRGKFTKEELENGAETTEVITVMTAVVAKISSTNPT